MVQNLPMIGFFALLIALLTLLSPSAPEGKGSATAAEAVADAASPAGGSAALEELLGTWHIDVAFPDGAGGSELRRTEMILGPVAGTPPGFPSPMGALHMRFGPEDEQWRGTLSTCVDQGALAFACRAQSDPGTGAVIGGRLEGGSLSGTIFLEDDAELLTWTGSRTQFTSR